MAQKSKVDALMLEHGCTRTRANNMLRARKTAGKNTFGVRTYKRRSVSQEFTDLVAYRKHSKLVIEKSTKMTTTIRKHKTSRIKSNDTVKKSR